MALPTHEGEADNLDVKTMVLNRLWVLDDTDKNTSLISSFTLEVMNELETCFRVSKLSDGTIDPSRIGNENYYTVTQRSIIADIVTVYILMVIAYGANIATGSGTVTDYGLSTFISKAKADEVEVDYLQFDLKKGDTASKFIGGADMINLYTKAAIRKARTLGCMIDICADCSLAVELMGQTATPMPFIHVGGCGCC